jgi:O-antigen/teichoic acid export membrane protein
MVPTASSLHATGDKGKINGLLINSSRYSGYICLPIQLFILIMGGELLQVWMGAHYRNGTLIGVMVLAQIPYIVYNPLLAVVAGLNLHGRPGMANFAAQGVSLLLAYGALHFAHSGLIGVAIAVGLPLSLVNSIYLPVYICRFTGLSVVEFLVKTWRGPLLACVPFAAGLLAARGFFGGSPGKTLVAGIIAGFAVMLPIYWVFVFPAQWKKRILAPLTTG